MSLPSRISWDIAKKLGNYVYLYVDPRNGRVFYVGKGKQSRVLAHLDEAANPRVRKTIREIRSAGEEPQIEVLVHGLRDEKTALRVEAAVIDLLGKDKIDNAVRGWRGREYGRMPLADLVAHYEQRPVEIREPVILVRIKWLYEYGMTDAQLYDATRSAWRIGERRKGATYAFAVFEGVVREVYRITDWLPGGSTLNCRFPLGKGHPGRKRWEFVGVIAEPEVRKRYVNRFVGHYFAQGAQNPITYVNVGE